MNGVRLEGRQISTNGRRAAQAAVSTKSSNRRREIDQAALAHAWDWFALHARQRMQCVNFFLVSVAFLAASYVTALTKEFYGVDVGISALGVLISFWFHRLDLRTKELVKAGEAAMKPLEKRLAEAAGVAALEIVMRVDTPGLRRTSYGHVLRMIHWTTLMAFLIGGVYALYLSGLRIILATP
jgi:hypothetical protein